MMYCLLMVANMWPILECCCLWFRSWSYITLTPKGIRRSCVCAYLRLPLITWTTFMELRQPFAEAQVLVQLCGGGER